MTSLPDADDVDVDVAGADVCPLFEAPHPVTTADMIISSAIPIIRYLLLFILSPLLIIVVLQKIHGKFDSKA